MKMDNSSKGFLDYWNRYLDGYLENIDDKEERRRAIANINLKRKEIKDSLFKTIEVDKLKKGLIGPLIKISTEGTITYVSEEGDIFKTKLSTRTNEFLLINFLAREPGKLWEAKKIDEVLNNRKTGSSSTPDRRVRDTVQAVKRKLGMAKISDSIFRVDMGSFGLNYPVKREI